MSVDGQDALRDMVEFEMYLVAQPRQTPWPMLPRNTRKSHHARPLHRLVESSAAKELIHAGVVEATSSRTFIVSKVGRQFYEQEIRPHSRVVHQART